MLNYNLKKIIEKLIETKKEGDYWDFKEIHHQNPADLILDIICLANNVNRKGDRYIIFGVDDGCNVVGVNDPLKLQADIICQLRDSKFSSNNFPDISLENIDINNKILQVIIIKDRPLKPYFLTQDKKDKNNKIAVRAGGVFSRNGDSNTPKDSVSSVSDIEQMWRERFGLSLSPLDRMKLYLADYQNWEELHQIYFYQQFPEFTFKYSEEPNRDFNEYWASGELGHGINEGRYSHDVNLKYHNTDIAKIVVVSLDDGRCRLVSPDMRPFKEGFSFFYIENDIKYAFQKYLTGFHEKDYSKDLRKSKSRGYFSIPVISDENELNEFLKLYTNNSYDFVSKDEDELNAIFYESIDAFWRFKSIVKS